MFIDEVEIAVSSGRGGDGSVSFRREKYIPRGGPDGGDGGRGGDVVLRATANLNTLAGLQHRRTYKAGNGGPGGGRLRHGANGETVTIDVPVGTVVKDAERGHVLRDLDTDELAVVIVKGGAGGKGNKHFAHATNQAPRRATGGRPGETRGLRLELKLVADVGLVGLPNAGKSTFLRRVSEARPKVAGYPFTTLEPVLGLVDLGDASFVMADIPGLIEGAHTGVGLGDRFLRHVQRTRVLLQLVDASEGADAAVKAWRTVGSELEQAGGGLADKSRLLVVSRADTVRDPEETAEALAAVSGEEVLVLSSQTGRGVKRVLGALRGRLAEAEEGSGPGKT